MGLEGGKIGEAAVVKHIEEFSVPLQNRTKIKSNFSYESCYIQHADLGR